MGKHSKVKCARQFSDFPQSSRIILCDVLVYMVLATSSCTVEKSGINFEITNEKCHVVLGGHPRYF